MMLKLEEGCHRKGSLRLGINGRRHNGDQTAKQRSSGTQLESRRNSITAERGPDSEGLGLDHPPQARLIERHGDRREASVFSNNREKLSLSFSAL